MVMMMMVMAVLELLLSVRLLVVVVASHLLVFVADGSVVVDAVATFRQVEDGTSARSC
jgi:hypothetical protein